jgi:hypothetical protein
VVIPVPVPAVLAAPGGAPAIGRGAAQRLARAELAKAIYHQQPSLTERVLAAIARFLDRLFQAGNGVPGGWWSVVALAAIAVLLASGIIAWIGPVARSRRAGAPLAAAGPPRTAAGHRAAAERMASSGSYAAAIVECVRAIAAELEERAVLPPRGGRTADEFAGEAGQALPGHAEALQRAALLFDDVCYGQRDGSADGYQQVRDLDARIRASAGRAGRAAAARPAAMSGGKAP